MTIVGSENKKESAERAMATVNNAGVVMYHPILEVGDGAFIGIARTLAKTKRAIEYQPVEFKRGGIVLVDFERGAPVAHHDDEERKGVRAGRQLRHVRRAFLKRRGVFFCRARWRERWWASALP